MQYITDFTVSAYNGEPITPSHLRLKHTLVNISNVIRSLADENKTVIVVSHDDELLENVSDCIIKVNAGRVSCK